MRIAFVNPPTIGTRRSRKAVQAEECCWGIGAPVLPFALLALASAAGENNQDVRFYDLAIGKPEEVRQGFSSDWRPDLVVHSLAWQWWKPVDDAMAETSREP